MNRHSISLAVVLGITLLFALNASGDHRANHADAATLHHVPDLLEPKTLFVTTQAFTGDLAGEANDLLGTSFSAGEVLQAADALCQYAADSPESIVPKDTYVALLSTDDVHASSRLTPSIGHFVRPDGTILAAGVVDLLTRDALVIAPGMDERGDLIPNGVDAWTGTGKGGLSRAFNCLNWTSDAFAEIGGTGEPDEVDIWLSKTSDPCSGGYRLYCVER